MSAQWAEAPDATWQEELAGELHLALDRIDSVLRELEAADDCAERTHLLAALSEAGLAVAEVADGLDEWAVDKGDARPDDEEEP